MAGPIYDLLPPDDATTDELLGRFLDYVADKGREFYRAQQVLDHLGLSPGRSPEPPPGRARGRARAGR